MRKAVLLVLLVLISNAWLQAQKDKQSNPSQSSDSTSEQVEGCLQSAHNQYTLTDKDGTTLDLSGAANKLGRLVGHEVQLTGTHSVATGNTTPQGVASSVVERRIFRVKTVKDIAKTCKTTFP